MKNLIIAITILLFWAGTSFAQDSDSKKEEEKRWKAFIEGGATVSKGNTREESLYSKNHFDYNREKWTDIFKTRLENTKVNDIRAKERYDVNNQLRYNYSQRNYRFLELEYVDDRYAGYDYRISETAGLGRDVIKKQDMVLSLQLSGGLRQTKFTDSDKDDSWLVRFGTHFDWKIKEVVKFVENLDIAVDNEIMIIKSDSSFRIDISHLHHNLYLQLGYFLENRSTRPEPGVKKTDTTFMTTIGYNF